MTKHQRSNYITRDTIMSLLSDAEVTRVTIAETAPRLTEGDEYIDLEHIENGVQRAGLKNPNTGNVLAKKAVEIPTWTRIVEALGKHGARSGMQETTR